MSEHSITGWLTVTGLGSYTVGVDTDLPNFSDRYDPAIRVVPYDASWPELFAKEAANIRAVLGSAIEIEHVGSTSVPGLCAKPVIDLLVLTASLADWSFKERLESLGYLYQSPGDGVVDDFPFFGKPVARPRQYHLHVCAREEGIGNEDLTVRDYLRTHPEEAAAYGALKTTLATQHPGDRLAYIGGKDRYVRDLKARAISWAAGSRPTVRRDGVQLTTFREEHVEAVMHLCSVEGWPSYSSSAELTLKALNAPGSAAVVAEAGEQVIGFAFGYGDGFVQGYLSLIAVDAAYRRRGIARQLIAELFQRLRVGRLDLLSEEGAQSFYEALPHQRHSGFRIYPKVISAVSEG